MAGFYPDVPAPKMALDKDGTQWFGITSGGAVSAVPSSYIAYMTGAPNDHIPNSPPQYSPNASNPGGKVAVVFPEPRDLVGVFVAATTLISSSNLGVTFEVSTNTTNGQDGTWSVLVAQHTPAVWAIPAYRSAIRAVSVSGVRGFRVNHTEVNSWGLQMSALHLYGTVSAGAAGDRLAFWHPTLDVAAVGSLLDWGDVARNTTATRTFRVKNLSGTKTAGGVRVALSSIVEASPTVIGAHALSADGSTWLSQLTLADLAPGALSPVLSLRRTTAATAQPGLWMMRVFAEPTTWT